MPTRYAYIDEAANLADENQFFIIGIVSTFSEKELRRILKRARAILGKGKRQTPEIKSSRVSKRISTYIFKKLSQKDVSIYAWIIDKEARRVEDTPENYGLALGHVLKYRFNLAGWNKVWVDEKYIKQRDKVKLEKTLEAVVGNSDFVKEKVIFAKSEKEPGLSLADFAAGSFYAAYNRGNTELLDLIKSRVVVEEKVLWRELKQKATAPRGSVDPD